MSNGIKILLVAVILGAAGGYFILTQQDGPQIDQNGLQILSEERGVQTGEVELGTVDSKELLALFQRVNGINLDVSVFESLGFRQLVDISVDLAAPTVIGRSNPFLLIGVEPGETVITPIIGTGGSITDGLTDEELEQAGLTPSSDDGQEVITDPETEGEVTQ